MITIVDGRTCEVCGVRDAVVICNGCNKALCRECRTLDLWGFSCGHAESFAFCKKCNDDPEINIYRGN